MLIIGQVLVREVLLVMSLSSHDSSVSGSMKTQHRAGDVRVLFIHASQDHLSAEYKVHKIFAESATAYGVESHFVWQRGLQSTSDNTMVFPWPERVRYIDFGRDLSLGLHGGRLRRARMMLRSMPSALRETITYVRVIRPDLIYTSQQVYDVRVARFITQMTRVPHVIHIHYTVGKWLGGDVLRAIQKTPRLIAVSEFIRQNAMLQGVSPTTVSTVPNPISPEVFLQGSVQEGDARAAMRAEFGWAPDTPVIIAAGRLDPMKGHHKLIEAFAALLTHVPHARLLICGRTFNSSTYPDMLKRRVAELGIQHAVVFAGHRYDVAALMRAADVFSLLSEMEPFGLVFLEAMAARLPVVAYYSGAVPEIVADGVTGLLSYPDQVEPLAHNMARLLSDRTLAAQMGKAGYERASSTFSSTVIVPSWAAHLHRFAGC
ncbi:glycosyltransferase family 4 protein [Oscillochloris sp. ZM17-4]|uniref:glycosyltransferase family 4 protein n=1 Tax=Oscillochloris sp. ZM17-4 TaxID=2866714 RepID=UPI001C73208D|nr:glycosyltransferase family 4 protein [Oscillochloris sp. ZM17-4]MBX0328817.1 glycosyltransferase family 4 protein [Oscillochloris sp. ZM17-4]